MKRKLQPSFSSPPYNDFVSDGTLRNHPPPSYRASIKEQSSLDLAQRLERSLARYNTSRNVWKRWLFEIASWTTSALCIIAIIGILLFCRDRPLSQYSQALTVVNVLSKIASAALILPVSEAIGQLKWSWFNDSTSKEMIDFEIFDKASRGAWGSFLLLFRTKGRSLAALGAILILLMLATDTFFQQVADLPERWALQGHGEIPRIIRYEGDNGMLYEDGLPANMDDINLRQVTYKWFYYNGTQPVQFGNGIKPDIPLSCPSSRCEWEAYQSLGFCSACADVSQLLTYACLTTKLDWLSSVKFDESTYPTGTACGYWLNATSPTPMLMSGYRVDSTLNSSAPGEALLLRTLPLNVPVVSNVPFSAIPPYGGSINYKHVYFPVLDALIVSAADGTASSVYEHQPPVAQECMMTWCVKTFNSTYESGYYKEIVTESLLNTTGHNQPWPWESREILIEDEMAVWYEFHGNISIYPSAMDRNTEGYGVSNETFSRTHALFNDMFPSSITVANPTAPPWWRVKIYAWGYNQLRSVDYCPWLSPNNITQYMERFATAMTDVVRSHKSSEFVQGRAYTQITFIAVHWAWLTFPLVLLLMSLIFLVATVIKTSISTNGKGGELGVWKTSALPTLIYSLPKDIQKDLIAANTWDGTQNSKAKKVKIRLYPNHGWRVSGQPFLSPTNLRAPPGWI